MRMNRPAGLRTFRWLLAVDGFLEIASRGFERNLPGSEDLGRKRQTALPGFLNTHCHLFQTL